MNKLNYKLYNNEQLLEDLELNYMMKNNVITFHHEDLIYSLDKTNNVLSKKDKEKNIKLDFINNKIIIELLKEKVSFDMDMLNNNTLFEDNNIKLEYTFESDEKNTNCILIEFK